MSLRLVATCVVGLEELLAAELTELGAVAPTVGRGAVLWEGNWRDCWRANWRLRTANRVLVELASWPGGDGNALARGARKLIEGRRQRDGIDTGRLFLPERTFVVHATTLASKVSDRRWAALRVKDGLVDAQRARWGRRASIDREDPDLHLRLRLDRDLATLYLDTSGEPLDRRGYRRETVAAPLREQLAAACVLAAGWDGQGPVVDPMCGSGTLLAEAGLIALGRAPRAGRRAWALERLPAYDASVFTAVREEPIPAPGPDVRLHGFDAAPAALRAAETNLAAAGLGDRLTLTRGDAFELEPPPGPGLLVVNPPYGERVDESPEQWKRIGDLLKQRYRGWRAVVVAGDPGRGKFIGLRPSRRMSVRNGPLAARILVFDLY